MLAFFRFNFRRFICVFLCCYCLYLLFVEHAEQLMEENDITQRPVFLDVDLQDPTRESGVIANHERQLREQGVDLASRRLSVDEYHKVSMMLTAIKRHFPEQAEKLAESLEKVKLERAKKKSKVSRQNFAEYMQAKQRALETQGRSGLEEAPHVQRAERKSAFSKSDQTTDDATLASKHKQSDAEGSLSLGHNAGESGRFKSRAERRRAKEAIKKEKELAKPALTLTDYEKFRNEAVKLILEMKREGRLTPEQAQDLISVRDQELQEMSKKLGQQVRRRTPTAEPRPSGPAFDGMAGPG